MRLGTRRDHPRGHTVQQHKDCWRLLDESIGHGPSDEKVPFIWTPMAGRHKQQDQIPVSHVSVAHPVQEQTGNRMVTGSNPNLCSVHLLSGRVRATVNHLIRWKHRTVGPKSEPDGVRSLALHYLGGSVPITPGTGAPPGGRPLALTIVGHYSITVMPHYW